MSASRKKTVRSLAVGIMAVSVFVAVIYFALPNNRMRTVAFAWSPLDITPPDSGTAYALVPQFVIKFLNGSTITLNHGVGGLNSTDIEEIQFQILMVDAGSSTLNFTQPYTVTFVYLENVTVQTGVTGEGAVDLGVLDVANFTSWVSAWRSGNSGGTNSTTPIQTYQESHTGYWTGNFRYPGATWQMKIDEIQGILPGGTDPVNVAFNTDLALDIDYTLVTPDVNKAGNALMEWSGTWGTFQLLHDGSTLLGFEYNFPFIQLNLTAQ